MATNFRMTAVTTTTQEVSVSYPQADGSYADGVLVTQFQILKRADTEKINKALKLETEETGVEPDIKYAYLNAAVLGVTNMTDEAGTLRSPVDAKAMCLEDPILRGALWDGYVKMINKSHSTDK